VAADSTKIGSAAAGARAASEATSADSATAAATARIHGRPGGMSRLHGPFDAFVPVAGPHVRRREREHISRRFGVARLGQRLELDDRVIRAVQRNEHAPQVEPSDPECRLTVHGVPVRHGRLL